MRDAAPFNRQRLNEKWKKKWNLFCSEMKFPHRVVFYLRATILLIETRRIF